MESDYECCGENCPVCVLLNLSESNIKLFTIAADSLIVLVTIALSFFIFHTRIVFPSKITKTLISQKIRIND